MTEQQILDYIKQNPDSNLAAAYRLGRKSANLELTKTLEKLSYLKEPVNAR